jgi:hypothetical protein
MQGYGRMYGKSVSTKKECLVWVQKNMPDVHMFSKFQTDVDNEWGYIEGNNTEVHAEI